MMSWMQLQNFSPNGLFRQFSRCVCFLVVVCFIAGCASLVHVKKSRPADEAHEKVILPESVTIEPPQKTFRVGERLVYGISWLGIPVGTIITHITEVTEVNGKQAYHMELTAKTNAFCSAIYRIDDRFETYMDTRTFLPLRHELHRREGRHKKDYIVEYDHTNHTATYHNLRENWTRTTEIPEGVQDPLSAIYFFRTLDVDVGTEVRMVVNMNEKNYNVYGAIEKKTIIEVPKLGVYDAFESQPYAVLEGKPVKKGRAWGYVSCDESRIPLFGVVDVWVRLIGRVAITLHTIQ
jgi:hypothetical protein